MQLESSRAQGDRWIVKLKGVATPEDARPYAGAGIWVARAALPPAPPGEFYQADLVGLKVLNQEGAVLGVVEHFVSAPANTVMVVRGEREHWLPVTRQHLLKVDLAAGEIRVDWPADF
jgi:16S rRNA processing protein RimM